MEWIDNIFIFSIIKEGFEYSLNYFNTKHRSFLMKILLFGLVSFLLIGCTGDPSLAHGVKKSGGGMYKSQTVGYQDGMTKAVRQCTKDGNKQVKLITSTQEYSSIHKKNMSTFYFKCI